MLFNEDKLLRENIEKYHKYKKLKAIKSDKVRVLYTWLKLKQTNVKNLELQLH